MNLPARWYCFKHGRSVKYRTKDGKVTVTLPKGLKNESLVFKFKQKL